LEFNIPFQHKYGYIRDEEEQRLRPGHWLGLVLSVYFSALILMVGWQEGHPGYKNLGHLSLNRVTTLQTEKKFLTFPDEIEDRHRTNAHSLIQNLLVTKFWSRFSNW